MKIWVLGSGSAGNAVLVDCDGSRILVDAGFGVRTLARRLASIGIDPRSIEGCVLTHDHADHMHGAVAAARRWGWELFATAGTVRGLVFEGATVTRFAVGEALRFSRMEVTAAPVPHDAAEPIAVVATAQETGARGVICYDLGHATDAVRTICAEADVLVLESNHDEGMLRASSYPPFLRHRIAGKDGHLSNRAAATLLEECAGKQLGAVVLAHLSIENNAPSLALGTARAALKRTRFRGTLTYSGQDAVAGPITPRTERLRSIATQYSLF